MAYRISRRTAVLRGLVMLLFVSQMLTSGYAQAAPRLGGVWGSKPVLSYFMLTPSLLEALRRDRVLAEAQIRMAEGIARQEIARLQALNYESLPIIQDPKLPLVQKRARIEQIGYNQRVMFIVYITQRSLVAEIGHEAYNRFVDWIEDRWVLERNLHGRPWNQAGPRTYQVYATRFDSKGAYTVALPDKCLKFANGGSHICDADGYSPGQGYSVFVSYKKSVGAVVGESGPWNVDDNYWSRVRDPQPRRLFKDLALGMPEAQAAYFNGYNGGKDQFGRTVTAPYGIDLARQVSIDIGLEPGVNDWITVSFLWTEGWESGSKKTTPRAGETGSPDPTQEFISQVETATPNPDGSVVHEVREGQTLWSIAIAYGITIKEIQELNGLSESIVILPGQRLEIRGAGTEVPTKPARTPTAQSGVVESLFVTRTGDSGFTLSATASHPVIQAGTDTPDPVSSQQSEKSSTVDPILTMIALLFILGGGLILAGKFLNRRG